jgi:alkylation response protein AidB-like acyl-CoA dehydrogenase
VIVTDPTAALARAEEIAETVFFPAALEVDRSDTVPKSHLDRLAAEGFYGLAGPPEYGGLTTDSADSVVDGLAPFSRIVETLASGCLATTFVWLQHHGAVRATAASDRPGIREQWTPALCRGDRRAGVVQAALRPGPSSLRAHARGAGWIFEGDALWVSGWGLVDTLYTTARAEDDSVVWALLDVDASLTATPQELVAVNASRTVALHFDDVFVPAKRVVAVTPLQPTSPDALRLNGALALAVARRCILLLDGEDGDFPLELSACREALDSAGDRGENSAGDRGEDVAAARAHAADLALRAAATLVVRQGAKAILRDHHGQRLMREAAFLLVFGTRAPIQRALLERLMT